MEICALWHSCEPPTPGRKRVRVPKLKGTTIGFALVPGRAFYTTISKADEYVVHGGVLLDHFHV